MAEIENHPLKFFLPENARILMLGSFPPKEIRWSMNFFYPNFQNDMWRIIGQLFFKDKEYFILKGEKKFDEKRIKNFCKSEGFALGDMAQKVRRLQDNASDKFLEIVEATDISAILYSLPKCKAIVITGQKAMDTLRSVINVEEPKVGFYSVFQHNERTIRLYRMPSSSRAYPMPINKKCEIYGKMFQQLYDQNPI